MLALLLGSAAWGQGTFEAPEPVERPSDLSGPVTKSAPQTKQAPVMPVPRPTPPGDPDATEASEGEVVEVLNPAIFDEVFVPYRVVDGRSIPEPLGGAEGDPVRGRRLYHNQSRGRCSLCHGTAEAEVEKGDKRDAPSLWRAGERLPAGHIRLWIVAPATIRPETEMPAFHRPGQRKDPSDPLFGGPLLTAPEVEDIVAYLTSGMTPPPEDTDGMLIPRFAPGGY